MGLISNGTTIFDAGALDSGLAKGAMTFIKKLTASSSATLSFVNGASGVVLDNTYKEYVFTFKDIHPATDNVDFEFNMSADSGSNYNVAKTTTLFDPIHGEDGNNGGVAYSSGRDLAQGTGFQDLMGGIGNDNDQNGCGFLHLFNPSSTTFVKHFISRTHYYHNGNYALSMFIAGYGNTTSAVNGIRFAMSSGNIDAGDICLYGIS
jgi:hypothetical protein